MTCSSIGGRRTKKSRHALAGRFGTGPLEPLDDIDRNFDRAYAVGRNGVQQATVSRFPIGGRRPAWPGAHRPAVGPNRDKRPAGFAIVEIGQRFGNRSAALRRVG